MQARPPSKDAGGGQRARFPGRDGRIVANDPPLCEQCEALYVALKVPPESFARDLIEGFKHFEHIRKKQQHCDTCQNDKIFERKHGA